MAKKETAKYYKSAENDFYLWTLVGQTRIAMHRVRHKELRRDKKFKITPRKAAVIFVIQSMKKNAVTPAEISRWMLREPHSISDLLKRMEKDGLVRKVKDLERKNMIRVELTKKGKEAAEYTSHNKSIGNVLSVLSAEERQQLWRGLMKVRASAAKELGLERDMPFPPLE